MALQELVLLTVAMMNLALGALVFLTNRKNPINGSFTAFAWSLAAWALTLVAFRIAPQTALAVVFLKLSYISAIAIAASLTVFMHYFPELQPFRRLWKNVFVAGTAILAVFLFLPGILIRNVEIVGGVRLGIQEPVGYLVFASYFTAYFFGALYFLYRRWRHAGGETRTNIGYIIWSVLTAGVFGVIFNLILPSPWFRDWRFTWLGPLFTAIIVVAAAYAIAKHRLLNVKILAAELLTVTIAFILFVQSIFANSIREFSLRFCFFAAASVFGWFLVRSVQREVKQKEQLERLTRELERANVELKKLDQLKTDFLSFASHQLRAPLAAVKGYISMMLEGTYGEVHDTARHALDRVYQSNEKLIRLVDDFLNLARIEEGRIQYAFESASVEDMLDEIVAAIRENARRKRLELQWTRPVPPLPAVRMDAGKIYEVIYNLVDNAVKYTAHGRVTISAERTPVGIRVSVGDTGIGLAPDEREKLFTRFGRAGGSRNTNTGGVGIGLYIAKSIIEAHGGRIGADSAGEYKGSTFWVELPLTSKQKS